MATVDLSKAIIQLPYDVFQHVIDERDTAVDNDGLQQEKIRRFKEERDAVISQLQEANKATLQALADRDKALSQVRALEASILRSPAIPLGPETVPVTEPPVS